MGDDRINTYLKQGQTQVELAATYLREAAQSFEAAKGAGANDLIVSAESISHLLNLAEGLEDLGGKKVSVWPE